MSRQAQLDLYDLFFVLEALNYTARGPLLSLTALHTSDLLTTTSILPLPL
jgi:hypothetical protein